MSSVQNSTDLERLIPGCILPGRAEANVASPLATLVGSQPAKRMLGIVGATGVACMSAPELASTCDVSLRVAERVVAARTVANAFDSTPRASASSSSAILEHIPPWLARAETEFLIAFALTTQLHVKATLLLAKGGIAATSIMPRDVFVPLVRLNAAAFILCHNHPGGNPKPSQTDVELTNAFARFGRALGIDLVDHIVVATGGTLSFCDVGLMPTARELALWDIVTQHEGPRNGTSVATRTAPT